MTPRTCLIIAIGVVAVMILHPMRVFRAVRNVAVDWWDE